MAEVPKVIKQWQMVQPTVFNRETKEKTPGKLAMAEIPVPELREDEVLVKIAGCGMSYRSWLFL
jgi:6-hydroxycyclohex-1-ene-1-carbonyl-CoA dehydrogenase